jgi:hypothetical protein
MRLTYGYVTKRGEFKQHLAAFSWSTAPPPAYISLTKTRLKQSFLIVSSVVTKGDGGNVMWVRQGIWKLQYGAPSLKPTSLPQRCTRKRVSYTHVYWCEIHSHPYSFQTPHWRGNNGTKWGAYYKLMRPNGKPGMQQGRLERLPVKIHRRICQRLLSQSSHRPKLAAK